MDTSGTTSATPRDASCWGDEARFAGMVRRGSPVRVRKRALRKPRNTRGFVLLEGNAIRRRAHQGRTRSRACLPDRVFDGHPKTNAVSSGKTRSGSSGGVRLSSNPALSQHAPSLRRTGRASDFSPRPSDSKNRAKTWQSYACPKEPGQRAHHGFRTDQRLPIDRRSCDDVWSDRGSPVEAPLPDGAREHDGRQPHSNSRRWAARRGRRSARAGQGRDQDAERANSCTRPAFAGPKAVGRQGATWRVTSTSVAGARICRTSQPSSALIRKLGSRA
jgi:hypothetical protein